MLRIVHLIIYSRDSSFLGMTTIKICHSEHSEESRLKSSKSI